MNITVGMPTYNDFDALFFTIQHLRIFHLTVGDEIVVVDNFGCDTTERFCKQTQFVRYIRATEIQGTAAAKHRVMQEATCEIAMCIDSHVLLLPGAVSAVRDYFQNRPDSRDLVQGPLVYDDLATISTYFTNDWGNQMFGVWGTDERGRDPSGPPFEIMNMGMGAFSCLRKSWVGFNAGFRGFGGEEGYIHEKFRQHGGRTMCLPAFRWHHKFLRANGVAYRLTVEEKLRNHLIGWEENCGDMSSVLKHFANHAPHANCLNTLKGAVLDTGRADLYDLREIVRLSGLPLPDDYPSEADATDVRSTNRSPLVTCFIVIPEDFHVDEWALRRSVLSFLRQDHPAKELVILNCSRVQEIRTYAARTRVIRPSSRLMTIESIGRFLLSHSKGDRFVTWPLDGAAATHRVSTLVERIGDMDLLEDPLPESGTGALGYNGIITRAAFADLMQPLSRSLLEDQREFLAGAIDEPLIAELDRAEKTLFPVRPPIWVTTS